MGRSVSRPSNAEYVFYANVSELEDELDWELYVENIINTLQTKYPSLYASDKWLGREDRVLLENDFVYIGISEYCGLVSLWVVVNDQYPNLAYNWVDIAAQTLKNFADLVKISTFSNGNSIYQKI